MRALLTGVLGSVVCLAVFHGAQQERPEAPKAVAAVLDTLHDAASKADGDRYFACFDASAVFLGTDATERWTFAEFREYAAKRFATGTGWTYHPRDRHISFSDDRHTAFFDERVDNEKYGECRGTGALVLRDGRWKIVQYN